MSNWFVLTFLAVLFLVACQPKSKTNKILSQDTLAGSASLASSLPTSGTSFGTSDQGGGGNLIRSKPIDFYRKDITSWPEYIKYIQPIDEKINSIRDNYQGGNGVAYLKTLAKKKTWYLIPMKIENLNKARIGVGFRSTQGAFQTTKEVFISELVYKKMTEVQRAQLLLHEIVMAFYRVKYESAVFYCEAFLDERVREGCLGGANDLDKHVESRPQVQPRGVFLQPTEYEPIRHVTEWLFSNYQTMSMKDFEAKMIEKNFDPRVFNRSNFVASHEWEKENYLEISDFLLLLKNMKLRGMLPEFCGFSSIYTDAPSKTKCRVKFFEENKNLRVKIGIDGKSTSAADILFELPYGSYHGQEKAPSSKISLSKNVTRNGVTHWVARLTEAVMARDGQRSHHIEFNLLNASVNEYILDSVALKPIVWIAEKHNSNSLAGEDVKLTRDEETIQFISTRPLR